MAEILSVAQPCVWVKSISVAEPVKATIAKPSTGLVPCINKNNRMSKGFMYILKGADDSYYTGSTLDLELRFAQHQNGDGANHTRKRLPVALVYYEEYQTIAEAFQREKQVQGWSRKKKEALIENRHTAVV